MSTKLDIINAMLVAVSEAPVTSDTSMHPSAIQARAWLDSINKAFQQSGWWFNTEYSLPLSPNEESRIIVPAGTMGIVITSHPSYYVKRGRYMYDPVQHTYEFSGSITANVVLLLDIEDLPPAAYMYLQTKCVHDFYIHEGTGDANVIKKCQYDLLKAQVNLTQQQIDEAKVNAFNSPLAASIVSALPNAGISYNPTYPGGRR